MVPESVTWTLRHYANPDSDPDVFREDLSRSAPHATLHAFHDDFARAVRAGQVTPEVVNAIMLRNFTDQQQLDSWLRAVWQRWFPGEEYPA